ncbi:hypothetical protein M2418_000703 [Rhizobium sp. BIGb0125]|nr:hypothetical protein [Rhizobium sp. BIGb0125]
MFQNGRVYHPAVLFVGRGVSYLCRLLMLSRHRFGSCDEYGKEKARGVSDFAGFVVSLIQDQTSFLRDSKMQASVMTAAAQR